MAKSPILGGFSRSLSKNASDNDAYNLLVEIIETKDGKVPGALYLAAGLDLVGNLGNGPVRGVLALLDILYVVSGPEVFSLTANGVSTLLGTVVDVATPVSMFQNGRQLMILDGVGAWLVPGGYPLTGGTITGDVTNPNTGANSTANGVAGSLYAVNDTITLLAATGIQSSFPIVTVTSVTNNAVTFFTLPNAGTTYNTGMAQTTQIQGQPGVGSGLTLNVTASSGAITAASVDVGGSAYALNDTGTVGTSNAFYRVSAVSAGVVTAVIIISPGSLSSTATGVATTPGLAVPPNVGTGLTINITATGGGITASTLGNGGENYVVGNVGFISGGSGDATYLVTAIGGTGAVTGFTVTQSGTVNSPPLSFTQKSTSGSGAGFTLTAPTFGPFLGLVPITLPFPNPLVGGISDGFGLMVFLGSQNLAASDELDLSTWDPLSYGVSNQSPDNAVSLAVFHDEVYVLKEQNGEVWEDAGQANFAFQILSSVHIEFGCAATFSPARVGNELIWISRNDQGQGIVVATESYVARPISTQALVAEFDTYPQIGDAIGYARQQGGHDFYVLTFPEADKTWVYDATASRMAGVPLWHRLASWTDGAWHRHLGNCFTPWRGSLTLTTSTTTYTPNAVLITTAELQTASGIVGLPLRFSTAAFSVWLDIPDGTTNTGIVFGNGDPGTISIAIQNDQSGTPQIAVVLKDSTNTDIVSAAYGFTNWAAWVNVLISIDTATESLQVWANTIVGETLVETELTGSITWSSSNLVAASQSAPLSLNVDSVSVPAIGGRIAQLVVPSDAFGTPTNAIIDWPRGKVYLLSSSANTLRVYDTELVTQNPLSSANMPLAWSASDIGAIALDPVTGYLLMPGATYENTQQIATVNPQTASLVATFGALVEFPSYPTSIDAMSSTICVGCGTVASGGDTQVGYAFMLQFGIAHGWAAIRTDTMTAAGFDTTIASTASCTGLSGPSGGSVFIANANGSASVTLSTITVTPGAETYDISTWPTGNPHINSATIGTIAATAVDATATTISCSNMGYDRINNIVILDVTTNGTATPQALLGVNPASAAILWQTAASGGTTALSACRIDGEVALLAASSGGPPPVGGGADVITTATGTSVTTSLNGVVQTYAAGDDIAGWIVINAAYTETTGSPAPVSGTASSFTGFAILAGAKEPSQATIADLWFSNTAGFVDFTTVANRRNFISDVGGAQNLGADGSAPFGVTPPVFLTNTGMPASFATNAGRGGAFIVSGGTLAAGASDPPGSGRVTVTQQPFSPGDGVLGDYSSGNLYALNPATLTDNGTQRRWLRRWRALPQAGIASQRFSYLSIVMETGINVPAGTTPHLVLRWSDDGGNSWSNERIGEVGAKGQTSITVKFNRLGSTRRFGGSDRIFELSSSDPFMVAILDADVEVS
jgi:hypothetical protein